MRELSEMDSGSNISQDQSETQKTHIASSNLQLNGKDAEGSQVDPAIILGILLGNKGTILRVAVPIFLVALVISFLLPAQYTSTATIIPPASTGSSSAAALMGQLSALGVGAASGGLKSPGELYVGILKSRSITSALVERFKLLSVYHVNKESEAEGALAKHTDVQIGPKDGILSIAVVDHDPVRARDLAKGYLDALREKTAGLALTESSQRRLFYEDRLAKEKNDLADAEVALKQMQESTGLIAPAGQTASQLEAIAQLQAQIAGRRVSLASLLTNETEQNPDVIRLNTEIADLQNQIAHLQNGGSKSRPGSISTAQVPSLDLEYIRAEREVKYHEALFEIISRQYEAARIDEARDTPLQVLDVPQVPDTKSGPPRRLIAIIGLFLGLLFGAMSVLFQAYRRAMAAERSA
jgi:tyrosine-protein kinase Etk/Wzc